MKTKTKSKKQKTIYVCDTKYNVLNQYEEQAINNFKIILN